MLNVENAKICATLSKLVYQKKEVVLETLEKDFEQCDFFDNDGTQCLLAASEDKIFVVFRGTEPTAWEDVKADLNFFKVKADTAGRVHGGFKESCDDLYEEIRLKILLLRTHEKQQIIISGHSLGAAVATLFASRIKADQLYTFGSPRVGDKRFVDTLCVPHWRFVNNNDIVTFVPPILMFYHDGELKYFNSKQQLSTGGFLERVYDRALGYISAWKKLKFFDGISDHDMGTYEKLVHGLQS